MRFRSSLIVLLLALAVLAWGQQPPRAPRETTSVKVNGKAVSINYGRPSLNGRTIDDLLKKLPPDRMWRAGANQVTTLTTETDLVVGGKTVAAGKYSIYVHVPETGNWELAINKDPGIELGKLIPGVPPAAAKELWAHLDGYDKNIKDQEVARVEMKPGAAAPATDLFTIALTPSKNGALVTISWGDRSWAAELNAK